jgi:hypothetical protein
MQAGIHDLFLDQWFGPYGANFDYNTWPADNPSTLGNGVWHAPNSASWGVASPERQLDIWAEQLKQITPPALGGSAPCIVDVLNNYLGAERQAVTTQLVKLENNGCTVKVMGNQHWGSDGFDQADFDMNFDQINQLTQAGAQVRASLKLHDKMAVAYGTIGGVPNQRVVWGGSHNLTGDALLINDELLTRVDGSTSVYNAYLSHFNTAWNNPSMTFIAGD